MMQYHDDLSELRQMGWKSTRLLDPIEGHPRGPFFLTVV